MSTWLFTSAGHASGVTALTLALATLWPDDVLLVDGNREPDQSVLAGYLQGANPAGRGLGAVLQAHRERRPLAECLPGLTLPLGDASSSDFLPGFAHPGMVALFAQVWPDFAAALSASERTVLVDAGRIGPTGLPLPMVSVSSGVVVVTGSRLVDLAALRLYLPLVVASAGEERVGLVVVGPNRPYGTGEISERFGVPVWGKVAWSPAEAAVFAAGERAPRRRLVGPYLADVRALAVSLLEQTAVHRSLIGVPR